MIGLWLVGCVVGGGEQQFVFDGATDLVLNLGNGDITVRTSGDEALVVRYDGGGVGRAAVPEVYQDEDGGVVVDSNGALGGGSVEAWLPAGIELTALVDRGDIDIELVAPSDIDACAGAGSVSIGVPAGSYDLNVGAGFASVSTEIVSDPDAEHRITACVGAGDIDVHVTDPDALSSPF